MKFTGMFLILALFFSMFIVSVAQAYTTKLYVDPSKVECWAPALDETFVINVTVANVSNLRTYNIKLYWNTTLLDLVEVNVQPFFDSSYIDKNETNEDQGWYWLHVATLGGPKTGSGVLVTLSFKITYEPEWPENATCTLDLTDTRLEDWPSFEPILHDVIDGEYSCYSTPPLSLTTVTDKLSYEVGDSVHIYGNLTLGSSPVQDGIVALEVVNDSDQTIVIRCQSTGVPPASQIVEIVDVTPCDDQGNPQTIFYRGYLAHFNVTIRNNDIETRPVLITINTYDAENRPIGIKAFNAQVTAGATSWVMLGLGIPDTASFGEAMVYASTLNKWPKAGGTAYCPEKSATFEISGSGSAGAGTQSSSSNPEGTYNLTFKLPSNNGVGNYTVYASSEYMVHEPTQKTRKVTNEVTFEVVWLKYDFDGDGEVDIGDVRRVARAYGSAAVDDPETPYDETENWDPVVDVAPEGGNGKITIADVREVARHYGETI